jgi:hypothetical protein
VKEPTSSGAASEGSISRREFLTQSATAALGFAIIPRHVLGGAGYVPPSDKVNVAFIGVGSQGQRVMLKFLKESDVQAIAVCDPYKGGPGHPQWDTHEFCNSVRELLGVTSGWDWLSPDDPIQLTHALQVTSGVSGREPCQKIVEGYYGSQQRSGNYHGCSAYSDFRELLEKQKDLDAVVVCTTDSLHAAVSVAAMKKGKHVFCQKPLTHTIYEAQVANWSSRPFWPQGLDRPKQAEPVPDGLDWDLWLGPALERPYNHVYAPFVWRGWVDFGCGSLGDMGS